MEQTKVKEFLERVRMQAQEQTTAQPVAQENTATKPVVKISDYIEMDSYSFDGAPLNDGVKVVGQYYDGKKYALRLKFKKEKFESKVGVGGEYSLRLKGNCGYDTITKLELYDYNNGQKIKDLIGRGEYVIPLKVFLEQSDDVLILSAEDQTEIIDLDNSCIIQRHEKLAASGMSEEDREKMIKNVFAKVHERFEIRKNS